MPKFERFDIVRYVGRDWRLAPKPDNLGIIDQASPNSYSVIWRDSKCICSWFEDNELELVKKFEWPSVI